MSSKESNTAGFQADVAFYAKEGIHTFEELGDGARTVVRTEDGLFRRAVVVKLNEQTIWRLKFRRGVYTGTDTILYASACQVWHCVDGFLTTEKMQVGAKLESKDDIAYPWELIEKVGIGEGCAWNVAVSGGDTFMLRNDIPALALNNGEVVE